MMIHSASRSTRRQSDRISGQPEPRLADRNQLIDVLRGVSILLVLISHLELLPLLFTPKAFAWTGRPTDTISTGFGYYGVSLFFVISGFLITSLSLRRYGCLNQINFADFWWRRFARIMPMLLFCVAWMLLYHVLHIGGFVFVNTANLERSVMSLLCFRFYELLNSDQGLFAWNQLWSLSVEEMFYLAFPFLCLALSRRATSLWVGSVVIFTAIYLRLSGQESNYSTLGCMDLLAVGCLTAIARPERLRAMLSRGQGQWLGIALVFGAVVNLGYWLLMHHPSDVPVYGALFCGLSAVAVIVASQLLDFPRFVSWGFIPLSFLGVISYEVYLLHMPVRIYLKYGIQAYGWWTIPLTLFVSWFMHHFFAEPANKELRAMAKNPGQFGERSHRFLVGGGVCFMAVLLLGFAAILIRSAGPVAP